MSNSIKISLVAFLIFNTINLYAQNEENKARADSIMNLAISQYDKEPIQCIEYFKKASVLYDEIDENYKQAMCYQNICFVYNEKLDSINEAIKYCEKSIAIWKNLDKPIKQANLLKYLGWLKGKTGYFKEGRASLHEAIGICAEHNNDAMKAVCYLNLARLLELEGDVDSCIFYANKSKEIFKSKKFLARVYIVNSFLLDQYTNSNSFDNASLIFNENLEIEETEKLHWQNKIDFYLASQKYLEKTNDNKRREVFKMEYELLIDSLRKEGIKL